MRTIKFRAWDEIHKTMHSDFKFITSGDDGNDWIIFTSDKQPLTATLHPFENPFFQQQFKIMQFTGLTDKNGKEIYEGDILHFSGELLSDFGRKKTGKYDDTYEQVIWMEDSYGAKVLKSKIKVIGHESKGLSIAAKYGEVIGNIHENPDLLK